MTKSPDAELDRELIDTFYMNVEATDGGGLRTSVQLIVKLDDVNDNRPQFISNLYSSSSFPPQPAPTQDPSLYFHHTLIGFIEENAHKWFEPIRLQAFDRDLGLNGLVEYEIESSNASDPFAGYFTINNITKCVDLKPNVTLDFEHIVAGRNATEVLGNPGEVNIDLVIVARDFGRPSLSSKINARVVVKVLLMNLT